MACSQAFPYFTAPNKPASALPLHGCAGPVNPNPGEGTFTATGKGWNRKHLSRKRQIAAGSLCFQDP